MANTAKTKGAHHIGLTVPDLAKTREFFIETLGFEQVCEKPDYPAVFVSDGVTMITIWQAKNAASAVPFDRKNIIGLHHFALRVDGAGVLDQLHDTLKLTEGVEIEFAPEPLGAGPTKHMMCFIPGGIRVEFITPESCVPLSHAYPEALSRVNPMHGGWPHNQSPFHIGEQQVQERLGVRERMEGFMRNYVRDHIRAEHRDFFELLPNSS